MIMATPRVLNFRDYNHVGLPPGTVYSGRANPRYGLRASKWANPFMIERDGARDEVIAMYERWLRDERPDLMAALPELRGNDLVCWCAPLACHGDVLLRLANNAPRRFDDPVRRSLSDARHRLRAVRPTWALSRGTAHGRARGRSRGMRV
jgi:Domain of unknown function (DUF4326)